jgi:CBS domain-containing protein
MPTVGSPRYLDISAKPVTCVRDVALPHDVCGAHDAPAPRAKGPMQVRDLMTTALVTALADTPVVEARKLMQAQRIRHLLVTSPEGKLQGIVTDRDIRMSLPSPATSLSVWELNYLLARLTVGEVMMRGLVVTWPESTAMDAARVMIDHKLGALPVVDAGRLVGIITESDFVKAFAKGVAAA